jgi:DNA polymerase-4
MELDLSERVVAHVDLDAFFVSVELLRRPELRGKPVIIAGSGPRAVVATASYEARGFGVGSAIPAARARQLCPEGIFLRPDMPYYREVSSQVMERVAALGAPIERASVDEVYIELTGTPDPVTRMRALVEQVRSELSLDASVGIGPNKLVAKVCSDAEKPRGFVVLGREDACERFAPESPRLLPGIGPKTAERLKEMGVETIARLQTFPLAVLQERFGERSGLYLHRRGQFLDDAPVAERERKSVSVEETFDSDLRSRRKVLEILERQSGEVAGHLRRKGRRGKTISIKVRHRDFSTVTRSRTIDTHTDDAEVIWPVVRELLLAYGPPRSVRLLGVRVAGFDAATDQAGDEAVADAGAEAEQLGLEAAAQ